MKILSLVLVVLAIIVGSAFMIQMILDYLSALTVMLTASPG